MNNINLFRDAAKMISACAIFAQVALCGCAGPKITALDVEIARTQAETARACYASHALPHYEDARDAALVVMARALAPDPCKTTNVYDARRDIAAAQNQAAGQAVGGVVQGAAVVAGIVAGADVLKTAVRNTGGSITGDGNTVYDTRSNISNRQTGDGATLTAPASGPDQHRHTTTTHMHMP